ncbi:hypothetical protein [Roseobacter sinensis]|uniref:Uncharacterized protein n=1 Tax=Roseobacter sinensis TaxID=2931391 RepID=A0ABT3BLA9_9RHOB|nr:hypothetical protein [Roseobacter sp. WL0113]MCV3274340.1 hypothetical protein [Roseobacter sp. WL0113]
MEWEDRDEQQERNEPFATRFALVTPRRQVLRPASKDGQHVSQKPYRAQQQAIDEDVKKDLFSALVCASHTTSRTRPKLKAVMVICPADLAG